MQIDPYTIMLSQDGGMHSRGGAAGAGLAATPHGFRRGSCGPVRARGSPQPHVHAAGAGPGGLWAQPRGRAFGWHSRT